MNLTGKSFNSNAVQETKKIYNLYFMITCNQDVLDFKLVTNHNSLETEGTSCMHAPLQLESATMMPSIDSTFIGINPRHPQPRPTPETGPTRPKPTTWHDSSRLTWYSPSTIGRATSFWHPKNRRPCMLSTIKHPIRGHFAFGCRWKEQSVWCFTPSDFPKWCLRIRHRPSTPLPMSILKRQ